MHLSLLQIISSNYNYSIGLNFINYSGTPQVPIAGVTQVPVTQKLPSTEVAISESRPSTSSDPEVIPSKCHKIMPTLIPAKSSSIPNLPSIIVPKLAVLTYALPEWINHPGGCKDYKCQICVFQHMNRDCMLTHMW